MGTDREMDADRVKQRECEGAGQARDRQTEGDWDQAWREDAGMIVEREQNSQPDALKAEMLASDGSAVRKSVNQAIEKMKKFLKRGCSKRDFLSD